MSTLPAPPRAAVLGPGLCAPTGLNVTLPAPPRAAVLGPGLSAPTGLPRCVQQVSIHGTERLYAQSHPSATALPRSHTMPPIDVLCRPWLPGSGGRLRALTGLPGCVQQVSIDVTDRLYAQSHPSATALHRSYTMQLRSMASATQSCCARAGT